MAASQAQLPCSFQEPPTDGPPMLVPRLGQAAGVAGAFQLPGRRLPSPEELGVGAELEPAAVHCRVQKL